MKIAWFTPFSKGSAVARFSSYVVEELAKTVNIEIWHPATDDLRESALPHHRIELLNRSSAQELAGYDALVYNFGNNFKNHYEIYERSRRFPGICILHDYVLQNFFAYLYLRHTNNRRTYTAAMKRYYGERGERVALDSASQIQPIWDFDDVGDFPLFEAAIEGAYGVVVHSEFFRRHVERVFPGPVAKLFLPYGRSGTGVPESQANLRLPEDRLLVLTVGDVNPNKRIDCVIRALAKDDLLRRKVLYVVAGSTKSEYADELLALVRDLHLEDTIWFTGHLPDKRLHDYLSHAEVCINLRFPTIEGASGSLVEQMIYAKPVIVSDSGCFSEVPDSCVRRIAPEREEQEIAAALHQLLDSPKLRADLSRQAVAYAAEHFRADHYAAGLLDLIERSQRAKPVLQVTDVVGIELFRMGATPEMPIAQTAANLIHDLFEKPDR